MPHLAAIPNFTYTVDNAETSAIPNIREIPVNGFKTMLQTHPFLFRVHDDRSYVKPTNDNDFIAREFVGTSANYVRERVLRDELPLNFQSYTVQQSVLAHICNWHKRQKPRLGRRFPWISGTPLWSWAIGEAIERNRMRDDDPDRANIIMLSVIDLRKLLVYEDSIQRRMVYYGMELLHLTASNQPDDFKKASNWTNPSQEIMVYGMIPASAVINTIVFADPFSTMTISPGTSLPLPPWFFEFFAVSNDSNRMIWPKCRWDDWYCGGHRTKGMREMLLLHLKNWARSRIYFYERGHRTPGEARTQLINDIASAAFQLAEFLVLPHGSFEAAITEARANAFEPHGIYDERAASEAADTLWQSVRPMAEMIARWGLEGMDNATWELIPETDRSAGSEVSVGLCPFSEGGFCTLLIGLVYHSLVRLETN